MSTGLTELVGKVCAIELNQRCTASASGYEWLQVKVGAIDHQSILVVHKQGVPYWLSMSAIRQIKLDVDEDV